MAMVKEPVIFQVAGYQNSGKTTLVNKLIKSLKEKGASVITVKHHGHGGKPKVPEGKDNSKHIESGAAASLVEGGGRLLIQAEKESWRLEEQIAIASQLNPDIILIEGHKMASYPKAVLIRNTADQHLLQQLTNIQAVFYWEEKMENRIMEVPFFNINDPNGPQWVINYLINKFTPNGI